MGKKLSPLEEKPLSPRAPDEKVEIAQLRKKEEQLRKKEEQLRDRLHDKEIQLREAKSWMRKRGMLRSVRSGIPLLDAAKVSDGRPSLSTGHAPAALVERDADFTLMADAGSTRQPVMSNVWVERCTTSGTKLQHVGEASVQSYVKAVLKDVIYELGLSHALELSREVATFGLRPDAWVMTLMGLPVGVVEVKNEGDGALSDERVAGELFEYMMRLPSFYGTTEAFGILTTYRKWRVCWMDNEATRHLAKAEVHAHADAEFETLVARRESGVAKKSSPEVTPSKKTASVHPLSFGDNDVDSAGSADESTDEGQLGAQARRLRCTREYDICDERDHAVLFKLLASGVWKM